MRRILALIFIIVLLSACNEVNIHENVDEGVANDSLQVMDRIIYNIDKDIPIDEVSDEDDELFERYTNKYINDSDILPIDLEGVDDKVYVMAAGSLIKYAKGASLDSDKESIKENYDLMVEYIETGEYHKNNNIRILDSEE